MHVMIDEPNEDVDRAIASHIVAVHQLKTAALAARYSMEDMQRYIKYARAIRPEMSDEVRPAPLRHHQLWRFLSRGRHACSPGHVT